MPTLQDAIFSLKTFAAAMLALYVAFSLDLPRPYWAMLTVYIVAQPLSGMVRSKALYRAAGTLSGAALRGLAGPEPRRPRPSCCASPSRAGSALCLYLSLLDRTPRAYAFMLAGYTAAIIGFPSVAAPEGIFDTALARSEEILLGAFCATLVDMLVLPRPVGPIFRARLDAWLGDAARWTRDALAGEGAARGDADRHRLVADAAALGTLRRPRRLRHPCPARRRGLAGPARAPDAACWSPSCSRSRTGSPCSGGATRRPWSGSGPCSTGWAPRSPRAATSKTRRRSRGSCARSGRRARPWPATGTR